MDTGRALTASYGHAAFSQHIVDGHFFLAAAQQTDCFSLSLQTLPLDVSRCPPPSRFILSWHPSVWLTLKPRSGHIGRGFPV